MPKDFLGVGRGPFSEILAVNDSYELMVYLSCRFEDEKNPCDIWGVTPIHLAAENGHLEIVQYLMKYLTDDKNPKSYGCTSVLDMAARGGHLEVFKYLHPFSNSKELRANNGLYLFLKNSDTIYFFQQEFQ